MGIKKPAFYPLEDVKSRFFDPDQDLFIYQAANGVCHWQA